MDTVEIFKCLVDIPSPSGFEMGIRQFYRKFITPYVDKVEEDDHGNLICYKFSPNHPDSAKTIMLVAHMDEIGLMVTYIEDSGMIRFSSLGGIDINILKGRKVYILHEETKIEGVIGVLPIHMRNRANNKDIYFSDLWIDIGYRDKNIVESLVSLGDSIVIKSSFDTINKDIVVSRGCDNKSGLTVLLKTMELLSRKKMNNNIVAVASVQEELGLRGAKTAGYHVNPDYCIAIDVCHATDYPLINKAKYGDVKLGGGPVIPIGSDLTSWMQTRFREIANTSNIQSQIVALPGISGTDINAIQVSRNGCATGLLSIPCRYMHSPVEMVSIEDIKNAVVLLGKICSSKTLNREALLS